jgi:predicted nucleotidyltransferase
MIETLREAETTVRTEILRCVPEAGFIALFGSFARGEIRPFSDIDIALEAESDPDLLTLGDASGAIEDATGRSVDIVLTRGVADRDPELAYKIAAEGVLLYEQRTYAFAYFKKTAFLYYQDTAYIRSLSKRALDRRVRNGQMGKRNYV